jgi:hypothetical protein
MFSETSLHGVTNQNIIFIIIIIIILTAVITSNLTLEVCMFKDATDHSMQKLAWATGTTTAALVQPDVSVDVPHAR